MRNILYIFISIGFAIVINSCEYNPIGEYERKANENVAAPDIQVLDLNLDNDTVFLYTGLDVAFRFISSAQSIKNVKFTVDGKEAYNNSIANGQFYIDYGKINEGNHTLHLEITTATGSGSIADHLGAEGFLFSKSWILVVDKSFYSKTTATSFNGFLKLSWPKYRNSDFGEYIVTRYIGSGHEAEIGRSVLPEFIDSSYVGEGASYYVNVSTSGGKTIPWGQKNVNAELPVLSLYPSENHEYAIKWGKYKYYNAVGSFNLKRSFDNGYTYSVVKSTSLYSDSSMIIPGAYFGDQVNFRLNIVPAKNNVMNIPDNYYMFETRLETNAGIKFIDVDTRLEEIYQVSPDEFVGLDRCSYLNRYSISKKCTVQHMTYQPQECSGCEFRLVAASPGGKYLTSPHLCEGYTMMIPSDNLNNYTIHNLTSIPLLYPVYMSDIGTAMVNTSADGFYIIDMNTNATLAHYNKAGFKSKGISISPRGNYILLSDDSVHLVKLDGSVFTNIWSDDKSKFPKFFGFDISNPEQLAFWDGNVLSIKDCSSFSTINEFPLTDSTLFNIDYYNKELLTYTPGAPGHLHIRDYSDGRLLSDIPVNMDLTMWWYIKVFLFNHYLVCTNGFMDLFE